MKKLGAEPKPESRKEFWKKLDKFAKEIARKNPGVSLSQKLIEMRYEQ